MTTSIDFAGLTGTYEIDPEPARWSPTGTAHRTPNRPGATC